VSRALVTETRVGTRVIAGTEWPVVDQLVRVATGRRVEWAVIRGLCNGVPDSATEHRTLREAMDVFGRVAVGRAAALLGARGGRAGSGKAKRRTTSFDGASGAAAGSASGKVKRRGGQEHYRAMAAKSAAARRAKKDEGTP